MSGTVFALLLAGGFVYATGLLVVVWHLWLDSDWDFDESLVVGAIWPFPGVWLGAKAVGVAFAKVYRRLVPRRVKLPKARVRR